MLGGGRSDIRITIPLHVLLPGARETGATAIDTTSEPVAELEGYGPVPPVIAIGARMNVAGVYPAR